MRAPIIDPTMHTAKSMCLLEVRVTFDSDTPHWLGRFFALCTCRRKSGLPSWRNWTESGVSSSIHR